MRLFKNIFGRPKYKQFENSGHPLAYKFDQGEACDVISNSYGEFGKEETNPVPVNGPRGEILYLNNLRTQNGEPILFHRISSQQVDGLDEAVDIFEVCDKTGLHWDIIFLHMYHPRNSTTPPKQYSLTDSNSIFANLPVGLGMTKWVDNFPKGLIHSIDSFYGGIAPLSDVILKMTSNESYIRPISHLLRLILNSTSQFFDKICDDISLYYNDSYIINLLMHRDLRIQFTGIKSTQKRKNVSNELKLAFCKSVHYHRDPAFIDEILKTIPKIDKEAHKVLKEINNPSMWPIYASSNFLDLIISTYQEIALPYLYDTKNNHKCPSALVNKIDKLIDTITYR